MSNATHIDDLSLRFDFSQANLRVIDGRVEIERVVVHGDATVDELKTSIAAFVVSSTGRECATVNIGAIDVSGYIDGAEEYAQIINRGSAPC